MRTSGMAGPVRAGLGAAALLALLLGRDASTAYGNPAGMTRLDSTHLTRLQASSNFIHAIGLNLAERF